ncbi:unknown protein [Seminavis robusta]|uniref:Uncharacterized protein n=1 Tax=Seminavis robusta TaxID=568900 RepID=A0A9N8EB11_9STRA|nr:unknown protein [Seminavis robusta]|eukprot:Sro747_g196510.1 n/a (224) ;mRNA; r:15617-16288
MTARSPSVYLTCQDIVGKCRTVVELPVRGSEPGGEDDDFWHKGKAQTLLIIAVPFRTGGHQAKQPAAFVPIIQQLQELHKKGFVHGDIRACNIVFGEDPKEGWLIDFDFDFGGEAGVVKYPNGYKQTLDDGRRIGEEGNEIKKVDDWYGLGQLIFDLHRFDRSNMTAPDLTLWELEGFWTTTPDGWEEGLPFEDQVVKLLKYVGSYRHNGYKLHPIFKAFLEN